MKDKMRYIFALMAVMILVACGSDNQQPQELSGEDIRAEVLGRARLVTVNVVLERPLAEMIVVFGIDLAMNASRADEARREALEELGDEATREQIEGVTFAILNWHEQNAITVEDIINDRNLTGEAIDSLPFGSEFFENGMVRIPVQQSALGFGNSPIMPRNIGMLSEDIVVIPSVIPLSICNSVSADGADSFFANFTLRANSKLEDAWKKEVLFDGTVRDLCDVESEYSPKIDEERSIAIFKRPASKVFQLPSEKPIIIGSVKSLEPGDVLYFAHYADRRNLKLAVGLFEDITENGNGNSVIRFNSEFNPLLDGGTPIYHVSEKNILELVAFTGMSGPIGIEAEFIFEGLKEIPHILGESITGAVVE